MKLLALTIGALLSWGSVHAETVRNVAVYNLENGVGLKGYDPVAVFPEGGSAAQPGKEEFQLDYLGVIYKFASSEHMEMFMQNPAKYEPTYGGWCAYAMASGEYIDIQPTLFTIHGNRAHYFVAARAKRNFDSDVAGFEARADGHWKRISGEDPRL
ncbi:MAG: YHS domain-containing (seleno)protein [Bdellovibrionales bacterium]